MDPLPHAPYPLAPHSQRACYLPWLKVSVALRYVRTFPWAAEAWRGSATHSVALGRGVAPSESWMVQLSRRVR